MVKNKENIKINEMLEFITLFLLYFSTEISLLIVFGVFVGYNLVGN